MNTIRQTLNDRYFIPLLLCSTLLGVGAGLLTFGIGMIPGGIAGILVAILWQHVMVRRAEQLPEPRLVLSGTLWGVLSGVIATLILHLSLYVFMLTTNPGQRIGGELHLEASDALGLGLMFGLPLGLVSGGLLGAIFGALFQHEHNRNSEVSR